MAYSSMDIDYPFFETSPASLDRNPAKEVMAYPSSTSETSPLRATKKCRKLKRRRLEGSLRISHGHLCGPHTALSQMSPEAPGVRRGVLEITTRGDEMKILWTCSCDSSRTFIIGRADKVHISFACSCGKTRKLIHNPCQ